MRPPTASRPRASLTSSGAEVRLLSPARNPTACALLTGMLFVLAFPRPHFTLLGFLALAPLLATLTYPRSRWRGLWLGQLAGMVFFAGTCNWIYGVMRTFGHLSPPAAAGVLGLFVVCFALFLAFFALLFAELARRWQFLALAAAPFIWVALEWLRTFIFFGGFPWNLLGYAVAPHIGWIQPAAYVGVYGVSFLLAAVNALVAGYWRAPSRRGAILLATLAVVLLITDLWGRRLPPVPTDQEAILVQTNLPQQEEFDPAWASKNTAVLDQLDLLTTRAARLQDSASSTLILWPEVPVSFYFHYDPAIRDRFLHLAQATRSYLLLGIMDFRTGDDGRSHALNSAVLLSPRGEFIGQYDKIHLVPFGEYLPLASWLRSLGPLVDEVSDFQPGDWPVLLSAGQGKLAVVICYEAIFPGQVREAVERGAGVLVNISNDGWYGRSAAAEQHLNMARLRAVETRRFLLRATNTGITAVVDPYGRVVARAPSFERATLPAGFAFRGEQSSYTQAGDWFAALCALVSGALLARKIWVDAVEGAVHGTD